MSSLQFRGTGAGSDLRFRDASACGVAAIAASAPSAYAVRVRVDRLYRPLVEAWVATRVAAALGFEDELVAGTVCEFLFAAPDGTPDPCELQLLLTGFLERQAQPFVAALWTMLADAQAGAQGIPSTLLEAKKAELIAAQVRAAVQSVAVGAGAAVAAVAAAAAAADQPKDRRASRWGDALPVAAPLLPAAAPPPSSAVVSGAPSGERKRSRSRNRTLPREERSEASRYARRVDL